MISPIKYTGYDKDNNIVGHCTGVNANDYINPAEVGKQVENIESVVKTQLDNIKHALMDISLDAQDAIIVQGTNMKGTIEDICTAVGSLSSTFTNSLSGLYGEAEKAHDKLQEQANADARSAVRKYSGVVRVEP